MEEKRFTLRMDGELFNEIAEIAKESRRSTAKEIELAVAMHVKAYRENELMKSIDRENLTDEQAREYLKRDIAISDKYEKYK